MKLKGPSIKLIISKSKGQCALEMEENHWQPMPTYMHVSLSLFISPILPRHAKNLVTDLCQVSPWCWEVFV